MRIDLLQKVREIRTTKSYISKQDASFIVLLCESNKNVFQL